MTYQILIGADYARWRYYRNPLADGFHLVWVAMTGCPDRIAYWTDYYAHLKNHF